MSEFLAATAVPATGTPDVVRVLIASGLLIAAALAAGVALMILRRRLLSPDQPARGGIFDDLRAMRDSGAMTQEEYDAARKKAAARLAGTMVKPADTDSRSKSAADSPARDRPAS